MLFTLSSVKDNDMTTSSEYRYRKCVFEPHTTTAIAPDS